MINEPAHDKTYNTTYVTNEDTDQPARRRSLTKAFADRMCLLQHPSYSKKKKKREPLPYCEDILVELNW